MSYFNPDQQNHPSVEVRDSPTAGNALCLRPDPHDKFKVCGMKNGHEGDCVSFRATEGGMYPHNRWTGPLSPEALYELKLDTVRKFINYLHGNGMFIVNEDRNAFTVDLTKVVERFLEGETK